MVISISVTLALTSSISQVVEGELLCDRPRGVGEYRGLQLSAETSTVQCGITISFTLVVLIENFALDRKRSILCIRHDINLRSSPLEFDLDLRVQVAAVSDIHDR